MTIKHKTYRSGLSLSRLISTKSPLDFNLTQTFLGSSIILSATLLTFSNCGWASSPNFFGLIILPDLAQTNLGFYQIVISIYLETVLGGVATATLTWSSTSTLATFDLF